MPIGSRDRIKLFWFRPKNEMRNFGDAISPLIVECIARKKVDWAHVRSCDLVAIGSLLEGVIRRIWARRVLGRASLPVWGTGFIRPGGTLPSSRIHCLAVRGVNTRQRLNLPSSLPLGDPGLLIREIVPPTKAKHRRWAIVPHLCEKDHPVVHAIHEMTPNSTIINLAADPIMVAQQIAESDFVLSSSLHGVVTANAFGIPCAWSIISGNVSGDGWKFYDYFSSVNGSPQQPVDLAQGVNLRSIEDRTFTVEPSVIDRVCNRLRRVLIDSI